MTTWVHHPDSVPEGAAMLRDKHLGAQRGHEGLVMMRALLWRRVGLPRGYQQHPATVMWRGHEKALASYLLDHALCWRARGNEDGCAAEYAGYLRDLPGPIIWPPWWGVTPLHEQHRRSLVERNPEHYAQPGHPLADVTPSNEDFLWPPDPTAPDFDQRLAAQIEQYDRTIHREEAA